MRLSRRNFLASVSGATLGIAGLKGWSKNLGDTEKILEEWSNHEEEFRVSICRQCPGGCGILVRIVDGRVVSIGGNPLYPVNQGGLCMKGLAGGQVLYDPDRIRTPLMRAGKRGNGKWKPISWNEALEKVAGRLGDLRKAGEPHTVAVLGGQYRGLIDSLLQRFCTAYGTPNYLRFRCLAPEVAAGTHAVMHGLKAPLCYDFEHSNFVLSFGCNLLESWQSTVHQQMIFGRLRASEQGGRRPQVVQVDTRYSVTAAKADRWVAVRPGTDGALAMGLAYVIIQEGLYDRRFVQDKTFGFEDWVGQDRREHTGFKTLVLEHYTPERVSAITGVPVATLFRLARDFANHRPAIAIGERGPSFNANDLYTRMAIHSLNALVGSIGTEGGIFIQGQLPLTPWEKVDTDRVGRAGKNQVGFHGEIPLAPPGAADALEFPNKVAKGNPYKLNTVFIYGFNPLFSQPNRAEWLTALENVPFVVSFSPFMDETTLHADLILPDNTYLESWQDDQVNFLAGMTLFGVAPPVVPPLYDTRQTEDVILALASALGDPMQSAMPWESFEALLQEKAQGLFEASRGHVVMSPLEEEFEAIMTRQGFWQAQFDAFEPFWEHLLKKGAWWDPNDSYVGMRQLFHTPSKKFEFYSQVLKEQLTQSARRRFGNSSNALNILTDELGVQASGDQLYLPHFEEAGLTGGEAFPFYLNTYKLISHAGGRGGNQPWLQQQPAVHMDGGWEGWVEINPHTAEANGIGDGDWVWLESAQGRIKVRARLFAGASPDVLSMPFGQGHRAYGRWAKQRGVNPNDIMIRRNDPMRGVPLWASTRVNVVKA